MWHIQEAYIDGAFVRVEGQEEIDIVSPATEEVVGRLTLANREDAKRAIAAAGGAQSGLGRTTPAERITMLRRLQDTMLYCSSAIRDATIEEYGGPVARAQWVANYAAQCFAIAAELLEDYAFTYQVGTARVHMIPAGVSALIAPWNSTAGTICSKLASAIAAGCAVVIKPSELSPLQTQVVTEAIHAAGLPAGAVNVVIGRGYDVGDELSTNEQIQRISFTGSTATGKLIARAGLATMKRVSLALSGKSASVVLDDADLGRAIPLAIRAAFTNSGQACVAGTRLLIPRSRMTEALERVRREVDALRVGDPHDPHTSIGPLVNAAQVERIQRFIQRGKEQGATLIAGGEGRPEGLTRGWYVRPTVFADVRNDMDIAREEIFGPVLSILPYDNEEEAVAMANDSPYGLQAYVFSADAVRADRVAGRLQAGMVLINRVDPELMAPFGGVKQSGIGREFGLAGLEAFLEVKTVAAAQQP
jgi:aldehyde dehydrogenase (NAD+)